MLCDEAFELAKGLLLENLPDLLPSFRYTLAQNELSNLLEQRRGRFVKASLELFRSLRVSEFRQRTAWRA